MNKKGVSSTVATVLVVAMVVVSIGAVVLSLFPILVNSLKTENLNFDVNDDGSLAVYTLGGTSVYDSESKIVSVKVLGGNNAGDLAGLQIILRFEDGDSESMKVDPPEMNSQKTYFFNVGERGKPIKVSIAPILKRGDTEVLQGVSGGAGVLEGPINEEPDFTFDWSDGGDGRGEVTSGGGTLPEDPCVSGPDGNGTIILCSCEDLQNMNNDLSGNYILGGDVDCVNTTNWNGGSGFDPIGPYFTGTLNGQGYVIDQLYINNSVVYARTGLFQATSSGPTVTIENLGLTNVYISGRGDTGAFIGSGYSPNLSRVYVTGTIKGDGNGYNVGGLIGYVASSATITNSYSSAAVTGYSHVGGLVGSGGSSTIKNSYYSGAVTGTRYLGGLVGSMRSGGGIWNSFASKPIYPLSSNSESILGGLVGLNSVPYPYTHDPIHNSYYRCHGGGSIECYNSHSTVYTEGNEGCVCGWGEYDVKSGSTMNTWNFTNIWQENPGSHPTLFSCSGISSCEGYASSNEVICREDPCNAASVDRYCAPAYTLPPNRVYSNCYENPGSPPTG